MIYSDMYEEEYRDLRQKRETRKILDEYVSLTVECELSDIRNLKPGFHEDSTVIIYCISGEINVISGSYSGVLQQDNLIMIPEGEVYYLSSESENAVIYIKLKSQNDILCRKESSEGDMTELKYHLLTYTYIKYTEIILDDEVFLLLGEKIKSLISELYDASGSAHDRELLCKIIEYIKENHKTKITLEKLEKGIGVSSRQITACMGRSEYGSFSGYMKYFRCIKADQMLCEGKNKVKAISGQCGFASENYFIKCFKTFSGKTPFQRKKEFQEERRKFDKLKECNDRKAIDLLTKFMGEKAFKTLLKDFD